MIVSFSTYGNIPHGLAVHDVNGHAPNRSYFLKQETVVVPDRKLMLEVDRQMASIQKGPYLDFFLALAICNTVVVSTVTAQRQRVRAWTALTLLEPRGLGTLTHNTKTALVSKQ